jgi:phosphate transport system substrate-binding protein
MNMRIHHRFPAPSWLLAIFLAGALPAGAAAAPGTQFDSELPDYRPVAGLTGTVHSVGSNKLDVISFGWVQLLRRYYPSLRLTVEARGSFTAAPALIDGTAEVAPTTIPFTPHEEDAFVKKFGYPPLALRVSGGSFNRNEDGSGAIAVYVNRNNPISRMTLTQLDAIFSTTRKRGGPADIASWGQLGLTGEWAARPITTYSGRLSSSIASAFRYRVLLHGEFRPTIHEKARDTLVDALADVVAAVADDPGAIGFAGFAQVVPGVKAVALAETENDPFIPGSFESVLHRTYPLVRYGFVYVNRPPGKPLPPAVHEYLRLALSRQGQEIVVTDGVSLPLPATVVREELAKIE